MTSAGDPMAAGNPAGSRNAEVGTPFGGGKPDGERQVPFFCPYCGEEELRPASNQGGAWDCLACRRGFLLSFAGLIS